MYLIYYEAPVNPETQEIDLDKAVCHDELDHDILEADWLDWEGMGECVGPGMYLHPELPIVRWVLISTGTLKIQSEINYKAA